MANRYTVLRFGSTFEFVLMELRKKGYELEFACTYDGGSPSDLKWLKGESGWTHRSVISNWCEKNGLKDFKIVRNTGYCQDLRGVVYELWLPKK